MPHPKDPLDELNMEHITEDYRIRLRKILRTYSQLFDGKLGEIATTEELIDITEGAQTVRKLPYWEGQGDRKFVKEQVDKILEKGIIKPATSTWASPVVLVKNKYGTHRFCVEYRRINQITLKDSYPLPRMEDYIDILEDAKYISKLD